MLLGVPLGLAAGYLGGWTDRIVSWLADLTFSLPAIVIIIVVLSVFPSSMLAGMVTFGVMAAPDLMRVVRSATLPIREELYIKAAEASGLSRTYILTRHILPRIAGVVIVQVSLLAAVALGVQTGLAFLNLLVAAPAPSWGGMVADGTSVLLLHPWLIIAAGRGDRGHHARAVAAGRLGTGRGGGGLVRLAAADARGTGQTVDRTEPSPRSRDGPRRRSVAADRPAPERQLPGRGRDRRVVEDVSFDVAAGEIVGIVGESGCGKSVTPPPSSACCRDRADRRRGASGSTDATSLGLGERSSARSAGGEIALRLPGADGRARPASPGRATSSRRLRRFRRVGRRTPVPGWRRTCWSGSASPTPSAVAARLPP